MRTEDRCLTGVTTSSAPPDCLAPVLPDLDQSEASLWSPDQASQSEASNTTLLSHGQIDQDYSLATMWGNVQTSWQYLDFCADLVDWNRKQKTLRNKYKNREYWFQTDRPSTLLWCKGWKNVSKFSSYRFLLIWNHENCWAAVEFRDPILWSTFPIRERILAGWKVFSSGTKTITILSKIIEGVLTMKTLAWRPDCWDDFISINFSPMIG